MALINCLECGQKISDHAPSCPHCGILKEDMQAMFVNMKTMSDDLQESTNSACNQKGNDLFGIKEKELDELRKSKERIVMNIQALPKDQREKQLLYSTGILFDAIEACIVAIEAMADLCNQVKNNLVVGKENALNGAEIEILPTISILSDTDRIQYAKSQKEKRNVKTYIEDDKSKGYSFYKKGDIIKFGKLHGLPIEWIILEEQNNKLLLLSKKALDYRPFHLELKSVTWERCTLRNFLNNQFFNLCFDIHEKEQIIESSILNKNNLGYRVSKDTRDKVFLLSIDEAKVLFDSDVERSCLSLRFDERNWWWLRTVSRYDANATIVSREGVINENGYSVNNPRGAIRPAIWISI